MERRLSARRLDAISMEVSRCLSRLPQGSGATRACRVVPP